MFKFRPLSSLLLIPFLLTVTSCSKPTEQKEVTQHSHQFSKVVTEENKDTEYLTSLGLMKGHLMVAQELIAEGKPKEAEPHIGHPVEEIYGDIEDELVARKVPEFKTTLNQFNDLVKTNPKSAKIKEQYNSSIAAVDKAILAVPEDKRQSPEFILSVINRLLNTAKGEYKAAIANNKIVEVIEYQDSRGFILYTYELYQSIAETMKQKHPEKHEKIVTNLEELKKAWPSVDPPKTLVLTTQQVSELIAKLHENTHL
ncbi:hypothetical protein [Aphanothece sacrum]|uniref:DNA uptake protein n=1 Tax=Aphanothece sacrum FPU1 TaxID=1920663 RepID=A0A401ICS6_APHSA|nr:hypothetical protein [Aphanothece sacrum]GBF79098.1 DNA uptake protein [Aphanothece sacrum FPU1]GBF85145.1 DNA uptake protein [Aphanothece sacrum FPU3]